MKNTLTIISLFCSIALHAQQYEQEKAFGKAIFQCLQHQDTAAFKTHLPTDEDLNEYAEKERVSIAAQNEFFWEYRVGKNAAIPHSFLSVYQRGVKNGIQWANTTLSHVEVTKILSDHGVWNVRLTLHFEDQNQKSHKIRIYKCIELSRGIVVISNALLML